MDAFPLEEEEEDEEEEFFETLDVIPSSPSSIKSSDQNENENEKEKEKKESSVMITSTFSRYEVWTKDSISILERRQRLFKQMGRVKEQGNANAVDLSTVSSSSGHPVEAPFGSAQKLDNGTAGADHDDPIMRNIKQCSSDSVATRPAEEEEEIISMGKNALADSKDLSKEVIVNPRVSPQESGVSASREITAVGRKNATIKNPVSIENRVINRPTDLSTNRERKITEEEFKKPAGLSPIDQELWKRDEATKIMESAEVKKDIGDGSEKTKKKKTWFHTIKGIVWSSRENKSVSDDRTSSVESSGRRLGNDSKDSHKIPKRIKVQAHKKSTKELTDLYLQQRIQAHEGAIWTMKFSLDGCFLATAGVDRVVKLWEVIEQIGNCSPDDSRNSYVNQISRENGALIQNSFGSNHLFSLSENTKWSFHGHTEDIMDLSWSPSQVLLSSSMDKTVRLWNVLRGECLRIFTHSDYVTCIQFNPVDDGYFISGSLDGKVRIWNIKNRQVVDWFDLNEMVTAACYTPDGQGAVVGSYKGFCRFFKMSVDNKLQFEKFYEPQRKTYKQSQGKKITGLQFIPGSNDKVLITSSDSRIRVYDGTKVSSKHKGLRNTKSQISASLTSDGTYIISASEDSRVCIWRYPDTNLEQQSPQKNTVPGAYEHFPARDVSVAIPWPQKSSILKRNGSNSETNFNSNPSGLLTNKFDLRSLCVDSNSVHERVVSSSPEFHGDVDFSDRSSTSVSHASSIMDRYLEDCSALSQGLSNNQSGFFSTGSGSATWPEESLEEITGPPELHSAAIDNIDDKKITAVSAAHGLVIVTASLGGLIQIFQNHSPHV